MRVHRKLMIALALLALAGTTGLAADGQSVLKIQGETGTAQIQADSLTYSTETKEITASGNVVYTMKNGDSVEGDIAIIKTDDDEGKTIMDGDTIVYTQSPDQKK